MTRSSKFRCSSFLLAFVPCFTVIIYCLPVNPKKFQSYNTAVNDAISMIFQFCFSCLLSNVTVISQTGCNLNWNSSNRYKLWVRQTYYWKGVKPSIILKCHHEWTNIVDRGHTSVDNMVPVKKICLFSCLSAKTMLNVEIRCDSAFSWQRPLLVQQQTKTEHRQIRVSGLQQLVAFMLLIEFNIFPWCDVIWIRRQQCETSVHFLRLVLHSFINR